MYSISLKEIVDEFHLEEVCSCRHVENILITSSDVNIPGLQLSGYLEHFKKDRIQIMGDVEFSYLKSITPEERFKKLDDFFKVGFPCMVLTAGMDSFPEMIEVSMRYNIPLLRTAEYTSRFVSSLIRSLNVYLAPRIDQHGVLVEVYGEGILILGESGVGKSETALELVKRGHRLIADDVVEIRKVSDRTLLGTAPDIIRHFIEIRGIGIIDVKNLFGMGAIKKQENIKLVVNLERWVEGKKYDRLGLAEEYTEVLGIKVPVLNIPVKPGRNLAIIMEVAAMNNKQQKMGYNAAKVLNERIARNMEEV
jgi:HPr kinase/phosphorylase